MACKLNNPNWVNSPPLSKVIDLTQGKVFVVLAIFDIIFLLVLLLFFIKNAFLDKCSTSTVILRFLSL
jgi:hypothetical protein